MGINTSHRVGAVAGALGLFALAQPAAAAHVDCSQAVSDKVSNTLACQYDSDDQTSGQDDIDEINSIGFFDAFGEGDFAEIAKLDGDFDSSDGDLSGDGDALMGELTISNVMDSMQYVLAFKAGNNNNTSPSDTVLYLLDTGEAIDGLLTVSYMSPLSNVRNGNPRDISNIRLLKRDGDDGGEGPGNGVIPVPAPLALLLTSIAGLGFLSRRRES